MPPLPADFPPSLLKALWLHTIEFADGTVIPGAKSLDAMAREFNRTFSPIEVRGKSVLDLGTWSGAFAVEAARRGAAKVSGLDYLTWRWPGYLGREAFDFVVRKSGYQITPIEFDLDQSPLSMTSLGQYDVVLFLGVFYHLVDPIAAVREIAKITKEVLVIETYIEGTLQEEKPAMMFYPGRELNNDPSNWWGPNIACVRALLNMVGFSKIEVTPGAAPSRYFFHAYR
jgi:tRNA (mo5U34)-methyltransferase